MTFTLAIDKHRGNALTLFMVAIMTMRANIFVFDGNANPCSSLRRVLFVTSHCAYTFSRSRTPWRTGNILCLIASVLGL